MRPLLAPLAVWFSLAMAAQAAVEAGSPSGSRPSKATLAGNRYIIKYKSEAKPRVVSLEPGARMRATMLALNKREDVEYAEPDQLLRALATPANDPRYAGQYYLRQTGVPRAWDTTRGSAAVSVCIVDSGIAFMHPDLKPNYVAGRSTIDGEGATDVYDDNGHGTHVAGIVGAAGNNSVGVAGVNWQVGLLACRFIDASGFGYLSAAAKCIDWCAARGARVISASFGGDSFSETLYNAVQQSGALFVAAAGNDGQDIGQHATYPAAFDLPNVLTVAATGPSDELAPWSNYSPTLVHLAAPGVAILSTYPGNTWVELDGTSMATPLVAGAAALALAAAGGKDQLSPTALRALLLESVDRVAGLSSRVMTGGRLNVSRLIQLAANREGAEEGPSPPVSAPLCRGVAYDGYLNGCLVQLRGSNGTILAATTAGGSFEIEGSAVSAITTASIVPAVLGQASPGGVSQLVPGVPDRCHDMVTLLPELLPLAAPTASCSAPIAISPASSLLVYGSGALAEDQLKWQLGIDTDISVGEFDAFQGALAGSGPAVRALRTEMAIKNVVLVVTRLLTAAPTAVSQVAQLVFRAFARLLASLDASAVGRPPMGRRLLAPQTTFNFTDAQQLAQLLQDAQEAVAAEEIAGQVAGDDITGPLAPEVIEAVSEALASLASLLHSQTSPSVAFLHKVALVASTTLSDAVVQLALGENTLEQFAQEASPGALEAAVVSAELAGTIPASADEPGAQKGNTEEKKLIRLVIGLAAAVGGVVLLTGSLFCWRWRRAHTY